MSDRPGNVTARAQPHNSDTEYIAMASGGCRHPVTISIQRDGNAIHLLEKVGDVVRTHLRLTPTQAAEIGGVLFREGKRLSR